MEELLEISGGLIARAPLVFKRYLHDKINWTDRLIGIKGARGVGKTTLLLQWLRGLNMAPHQRAYFSMDELCFTSHSLVETAKTFYQNGGKVLVLDEVHKYPTWSIEIKNLYDRYADLQIVFTGSSIIDMSRQEADLSRRALMYELAGMSYREFLTLNYGFSLPVLQMESIVKTSKPIQESLPPGFKPLEHFKAYLKYGYYPFYNESRESYYQRLQQLVRTIIESDMAELKGFDIRHAKKMLQLLYVVSQEVPFKPNINSLSNKTQMHRNTITNYLIFLHEARLTYLLYPSNTSAATLQKPEKVYLNNTNLLYALTENLPSTGSVREMFFANQVSVMHKLHSSTVTDFEVDNQYLFEIGGKGKSTRQIEGLPNARIVKDDIEFPVAKSIPLWLFGFLY
jgi:predicted AAA+ superfamily ATPase